MFRCLRTMFISFLVNCSYMEDVKTSGVRVFGIIELDFHWKTFYNFLGRERFSGFLLYVVFIFHYIFFFFLIKSVLRLDQEPVGKG